MDNARKWKSGLEKILTTLHLPPQQIAIALDIPLAELERWMRGEEIPEGYLPYLARITGQPRSDFMAGLSVDWLGNDYVANIGLTLPNREHSLWFPIGSRDKERFLERVDERGPIPIEGLGGSALIMFPRSIPMMTLLDEADDMVEGDWEIDPIDGVEGVAPEIFDSIRDTYIGHAEGPAEGSTVRTVYDEAMEEEYKRLGGFPEVEKFTGSYQIYFSDGRSYRASLMDVEASLVQTFHDAIDGFIDPEEVISIGSYSRRFVNQDKVAMIRFPNLLLRQDTDELV